MNSKVMKLIESNSNTFTETDHIISKSIIENPTFIINNDIAKSSKLMFVSTSSITRFCHKIKLPGYKELKFLLAEPNSEENIPYFDSMIDFFINDYRLILNKMKGSINESNINRTVKLILNSKCVYILGIGTSGFLATDFSFRIQRLGINSQAITDPHLIKMKTSIASTSDLFITISLSGETKFINDAIKRLSDKKIKSVLLTEYSNSTAAQNSSITILTPQKENLALSDAISNQFTMILVTDIIVHYIFKTDPVKFKYIYDKTLILIDE